MKKGEQGVDLIDWSYHQEQEDLNVSERDHHQGHHHHRTMPAFLSPVNERIAGKV